MKVSKPSHASIWLLLTSLAPLTSAAPAPGSLLPDGASKWKLTWSDEFDGPDSKLEEKWVSQNGPSGHILSSRWRENAKVSAGTLKLINKKEQRGGQQWTSGNLWTKEHFQYGYYECRYRYAAAEGTNNSFWIMTMGQQPSGKKAFEIDINEGHFPNEVNTNIHNHTDVTIVNGRKTHPSSSKSFAFKEGNHNFARDYQTYGLEWTEQELVFYFNGREIRREKNDFCHQPAPVWLSLAIIGWGGKITDAIDGTFMEVDYVRIYQARPAKRE
jgi:beta-glucanase (GH16 family)